MQFKKLENGSLLVSPLTEDDQRAIDIFIDVLRAHNKAYSTLPQELEDASDDFNYLMTASDPDTTELDKSSEQCHLYAEILPYSSNE